jgi:hypothetical protein
MHQVGNLLGVVDRRQVAGEFTGTAADSLGLLTNYADDAALDARLTAISAAVYPASVLSQMTRNDKVFAILKNDEAASQ